MTGSFLTRISMPSFCILPVMRGDVPHHDVGVIGSAELQHVPLGNGGVILDDPIAFGLGAGQTPERMRQLAAADA